MQRRTSELSESLNRDTAVHWMKFLEGLPENDTHKWPIEVWIVLPFDEEHGSD